MSTNALHDWFCFVNISDQWEWVFSSGLAVRKGKPHEELKKMIDMLGQSSVHSVVFHEEVCVGTCELEFEN